MTKVAILTCSNVTRELGCPSYHCFGAIREGEGRFDQYEGPQGAELTGIISCAGCPTAVAPEKLFLRIKPLEAAGVEAIHLSTCLMILCPFKKKYKKMLEKEFPAMRFIEGTHDAPKGIAPDQFVELMQKVLKSMLIQPRQTMADVIALTKGNA